MQNALMFVWHTLYDESCHLCSVVQSSRDLKTFKFRNRHEGLSFMTITLPQFVDSFTNCLENECILTTSFPGWKKSGQYLPAFLQGFTKLVFDDKTGRLLDAPSYESVSCIRQLGLLFKKYQAPCSEKRVRKTLLSYMATDSKMRDLQIDSNILESFCQVSDIIINAVFSSFDVEELIQHHGPGSTADGIRGNKKYTPSKLTWIAEWDQYLSKGNTFFANEYCYHLSDEDLKVSSMSKSAVKVITVPKTLKKPRIIAMEPTATQAVQQSIKDFLVEMMERHPLTKGHVNFQNQEINKKLALKSSIDKRLATIDMSDASDRIPYKMVDHMFRACSELQDMIYLSRTPVASVAIDDTLFSFKLNKYASMGSATCFPVEALYFYIILCLFRLTKVGLPITYDNIHNVSRTIYVYGDDIIIPANETEDFVTFASRFNCEVNMSKSFFKGRFRESCGIDAMDGRNVTPIYCRHYPKSKRDAAAIVSFTAFLNLLYKAGYVRTPIILMSIIEAIVGPLPEVGETCSGLGWLFPCSSKCRRRWNKNYQRIEYFTLIPHVPRIKDPVRGYNALYKCLVILERRRSNSSTSPVSLDMSQRRGTLTLKRRWVPA